MQYFDLIIYNDIVKKLKHSPSLSFRIQDCERLNALLFYLKLLNKFCKLSVKLSPINTVPAQSLREEIGSNDDKFERIKFYENIVEKATLNMMAQDDLYGILCRNCLELENDFEDFDKIYALDVSCASVADLKAHSDIDETIREKFNIQVAEYLRNLKNRSKIVFYLKELVDSYNEYTQEPITSCDAYFMLAKNGYILESVDFSDDVVCLSQKKFKNQYSLMPVDNKVAMKLILRGDNKVELSCGTDKVRLCKLKRKQYHFLEVLAEIFIENRHNSISFTSLMKRLGEDYATLITLDNIYTYSKALRYELTKGLNLRDKNLKTGQLFFYCENSAFHIAPNLDIEISPTYFIV